MKAQRILTVMEIAETRRIQGLGTQQRERLLARFASPS
ncbi:hypothetical protein ACWGI9_41670 [Streptomyces sp. NPDC054833]